MEDVHKYWEAALKVDADLDQKRARSPLSPSVRSSMTDEDLEEAARVGPSPTKKARYESPRAARRTQTAAQRLTTIKRKLALQKKKATRAPRPANPRQARAATVQSRQSKAKTKAQAKSLLSVDSSATATVSLGVYPPAPLQMPLNGPRLFVRNTQIAQNPTLAVATQIGKCELAKLRGAARVGSFFERVVMVVSLLTPPFCASIAQTIVCVCCLPSQALDDRCVRVHVGCA